MEPTGRSVDRSQPATYLQILQVNRPTRAIQFRRTPSISCRIRKFISRSMAVRKFLKTRPHGRDVLVGANTLVQIQTTWTGRDR